MSIKVESIEVEYLPSGDCYGLVFYFDKESDQADIACVGSEREMEKLKVKLNECKTRELDSLWKVLTSIREDKQVVELSMRERDMIFEAMFTHMETYSSMPEETKREYDQLCKKFK